MTILDVSGLSVRFASQGRTVHAVEDVSFSLAAGETLGIVGESGSGKSVTALSVMRLVPTPPGRIVAGRVLFQGRDLLTLGDEDIRRIRGREIAMIFQDPMTSLNPVLTIGRQLTEVLEVHLGLHPRAARNEAVDLLKLVGIPEAASRLDEYPHRFSGGMRQRVMIAMAVACKPRLLIADEPTTALDVTIQAQILEILSNLQRELGMAMVLITHDLGVVAGLADRVAVMYGGQIVEEGPTAALFADPRMPYTIGLLGSIPRLDRPDDRRLTPIRGKPPEAAGRPVGCRFAPRCQHVAPVCRTEAPPFRPIGHDRHARCHFEVRLTDEGVHAQGSRVLSPKDA
ncbi:MAG: ABC transporter ATP-binding protein [Hyphomicrobiales bacterium]|jgi:oligopeptide transport system ATP-binding protein|nr:ABC transporter ATP-binding protein [Hyphomicrobiales bacterium]